MNKPRKCWKSHGNLFYKSLYNTIMFILDLNFGTGLRMGYICHGRAAGRTRETRGKRNNGNLMTEHRIHNHIDELTDKDSGKTQGL